MGYIIDFGEDKTGIYGVEFNGSTNPGTRLYDSRGLQFTPSNTTTAGKDDFIDIQDSPFAIKEVVTKYNSGTGKQEILAYEGDANWSSAISDSSHNRMIEFPKFYYRRPKQFRWEVSTTQHPGFKPSAMHYRNGVMHDYVYVSKYRVNSSYLSQTGQVPVTNASNTANNTGYTIANFRSNFRQKGLFVYDYAAQCSITMLMLVKYAHMNPQILVGAGYGSTGTTSKINTGLSDSVKGKDGYSGSTVNSSAAIVAMGVDNFWGNIWTFMDGIAVGNTNANMVYINTNIEGITANPTLSNMGEYQLMSKRTHKNTTTSTFFLNANSIVYDTNYEWLMYPETCIKINWADVVRDQYLINQAFYINPSASTELTVGLGGGGEYGGGNVNGPLDICFSITFAMARTMYGCSSMFLS